ncbi:hypothetical protein BN2475_1170002 [Paraburkholderia ribeironis]|uniref:Uncharacterized protein n=1 Tax=Paraburkholderia ribeironis TaxID=1247936 RepID=A0A1N7SN65_9BURK|nr:hypothetical protein BN2475_1170002 [Paraburkholderia ribeironis]
MIVVVSVNARVRAKKEGVNYEVMLKTSFSI